MSLHLEKYPYKYANQWKKNSVIMLINKLGIFYQDFPSPTFFRNKNKSYCISFLNLSNFILQMCTMLFISHLKFSKHFCSPFEKHVNWRNPLKTFQPCEKTFHRVHKVQFWSFKGFTGSLATL